MGAAAIATDRAVWPTIFLVVGAGVVAAFQVGKAPMALSAVQEDLGLGLAAASWLISAFALVGAVAGAPLGLAVDRIGAVRTALACLLLLGAGSALGALSGGAAALVATRVLEGLGFVGLIVAAPAIIAVAAPADVRDRAMALWATFMPVGMTLVMLMAPLMSLLGWRGFWLLNAALLVGYAALLVWRLPGGSPSRTARPRPIRQDVAEALVSPGPWILAGLFAAFSAAFFAVFGFLPSYFAGRLGVDSDMASMLAAGAVAASAVGNLACGQLLARGFRPAHLLAAAFGVMAVSAVGIFSPFAPGAAVLALSILFAFSGGLVPVVVFDSVPSFAPRPELVGVTVGLAMQGNNVGLIAGPAAAGAIASALGWPWVALPAVAAVLGGLVLVAVYARHARRGIRR